MGNSKKKENEGLVVKLMDREALNSKVTRVVNISEKIYDVVDLDDRAELSSKYAYIVGDYVLPYKGLMLGSEVGVYKDDNGEIKIVEPESSSDKELYSVDKVVELSPEYIKNNLNDKVEISTLVNDRTHFNIEEDDNVLMVILKQAINAKGININQYKDRFKGGYQNDLKPFKNTPPKQALTLDKFISWCENLDIEWRFEVKANKNEPFPFEDTFEIKSDKWDK